MAAAARTTTAPGRVRERRGAWEACQGGGAARVTRQRAAERPCCSPAGRRIAHWRRPVDWLTTAGRGRRPAQAGLLADLHGDLGLLSELRGAWGASQTDQQSGNGGRGGRGRLWGVAARSAPAAQLPRFAPTSGRCMLFAGPAPTAQPPSAWGAALHGDPGAQAAATGAAPTGAAGQSLCRGC